VSSKAAPQGKRPFSNFPKHRNALNEEYERAFSDYYKKNRQGQTPVTSLSSKLEGWMHVKASGCFIKEDQRILEIGAGTLNHVSYERHFSVYDIVEPYRHFFQNSKFLKDINKIYSDLLEIDECQKYEKIISIAAFEHILNLPHVVAKSGLLLAEGGRLCFAIPNEGTILWRLGYTLTTGIEFKLKYGLRYSVGMKNEHINTAREIREIAKYFFNSITIKNFGINSQLAIYQYYECSEPALNKCRQFI
jgi:hypothetical protein